MGIDTSLWVNPLRMRERIRNLATMVLSLSAVNGFYTASQGSWIIFSINALFFLTTIPVFMSWSKYQKEPPKEILNE